jgi:hypothetical protein
MRRVFVFLSLAVLGLGIYLKVAYDVPDSQETINFFVSGFLMIAGGSGFLITLLWKPAGATPKDKESP